MPSHRAGLGTLKVGSTSPGDQVLFRCALYWDAELQSLLPSQVHLLFPFSPELSSLQNGSWTVDLNSQSQNWVIVARIH